MRTHNEGDEEDAVFDFLTTFAVKHGAKITHLISVLSAHS